MRTHWSSKRWGWGWRSWREVEAQLRKCWARRLTDLQVDNRLWSWTAPKTHQWSWNIQLSLSLTSTHALIHMHTRTQCPQGHGLPTGSFLETSRMFKFITVTLIFAKRQQQQTRPKPQNFKDMPMRVQKISPKAAPSNITPNSTHTHNRKACQGAGAALLKGGRAAIRTWDPSLCIYIYI